MNSIHATLKTKTRKAPTKNHKSKAQWISKSPQKTITNKLQFPNSCKTIECFQKKKFGHNLNLHYSIHHNTKEVNIKYISRITRESMKVD